MTIQRSGLRYFGFVITSLLIVAVMLVSGCTSFGPGTSLDSPIASPNPSETTVAQAGQPGIGGTGDPNTKTPGIGGTGNVAGAPGIGGTGIIGTVTGFGSILVNGLKVDYAPDIPVRFKDVTVRPDALRIGQVVEIEAVGQGNTLQARSIAVRHEVAGPIERIDLNRRTAVIFGQRIEIPRGIIQGGRASRPLSINDLAVGDHIDVSGLRRANGVIAASHIAKTGPGAAAVIRGRVTASDPAGFSVNGMRVEAPRSVIGRALVSGQPVQIVGTAVGGRLRARRVNPVPDKPFSGRVRHMSVEGYITRAISGGVAVGQVPITRLPASARLRAGDRIILDGSVDRYGRFAPSRLQRPLIKLDFPGEPAPYRSRPALPPRRQVLPPQPSPPPPVYRRPVPRPPVYRPAPRRNTR